MRFLLTLFAAWRPALSGRALALAALLSLLGARPAAATHIVGGQLRMTYDQPTYYRLGLTLYFDDVNGSPGARDPDAVLAIYEKRTNAFIDTFRIDLIRQQPVVYSNLACQIAQLSTSQLDYERLVRLDPARYGSSNGYYLVWERCCRNNTTINIALPGEMGQTFYLEFPALRRNGQPFINSSPAAFAPLRDYACVGKPYSTPFGGVDPDGDSLVYEMVTPLRGNSDTYGNLIRPVPPLPAPYRLIEWNPGFDSLHQINGSQPLAVNRRTGEISFTASQAGLYVFAVRCTEYRGGRRLGELRREFQELVVSCPPNLPPDLSVTQTGPPRHSPPYVPGDTLVLPAPPADRCVNLYAVDREPNSRLTFQLIAPGAAPGTVLPSLSVTAGTVNPGGRPDTLMARLCFSMCFGRDGQPLRLGLIVADVGCPVPYSDTVWVTVRNLVVPDPPPTITFTNEVTAAGYVAAADSVVTFTFTGTDPDPGATVTVRALNLNTGPLAGLGIVCPTSTDLGTATTRLTWNIACTTPPGDYGLRLQTQSTICGVTQLVDTVVRVRILPLPPDNPPLLSFVDPTTAGGYVVATDDRIVFDFTGADLDPASIVTVGGVNLNAGPLAGLGITCPTTTAATTASTRLMWEINCRTPPGDYILPLRTVGVACGRALTADTLVRVRVLPLPPDNPPTLAFPDPATAGGYTIRAGAGEQVAFDFTGADIDPDSRVTVQGVNLNSGQLAALSISCPPQTATATATTRLTLHVDCATPAGDYDLHLRTLSEACGRSLTRDTLVRVHVVPPDTGRVLPPNIITPNGDGLNDDFQPAAGIKPACAGEFRKFRIYSRWGQRIFSSTDRLAIWRGQEASAGLYFYFLEYSDRTYKGWVEVVK